MSYYTERHGMRKPIEKTYQVSIEMYALLFDCCEKRFDNIAWKYPAECGDGNGCCGIDIKKLINDLKFEIPTLYGVDIYIDPLRWFSHPSKNFDGKVDEYDQYALFDFIEFIFLNCRDISSRRWHSYYRHDDISFNASRAIAVEFRTEINAVFEKTGLLYTLSENGTVERVVEQGVLSKESELITLQVKENGLKKLLSEAILAFKTPHPSARQDAVEKIWDALERLKTSYTTLDKKNSAARIVNDMAHGQTEFIDLFNMEFKALTDIGNSFRIRHHETNKIDIVDSKHYDYFFNRCYSLIVLALQYLQ